MEQVSSLKTPNEVFTFAAKCITISEFDFDMVEYYSTSSVAPSSVDNPCGTSACIAGDMAYNLDPLSDLSPISIVHSWIVGGQHDYPLFSDSQVAEDALDMVFANPYVYRKKELRYITKDVAIAVLNKLSEFDNWKDVLQYLHLETLKGRGY